MNAYRFSLYRMKKRISVIKRQRKNACQREPRNILSGKALILNTSNSYGTLIQLFLPMLTSVKTLIIKSLKNAYPLSHPYRGKRKSVDKAQARVQRFNTLGYPWKNC